MCRQRLWLVGLLSSLTVCFSLVHVHSLSFSPAVAALAFLVAIVFVAEPRLSRPRPLIAVPVCLMLYVGLKLTLDPMQGGGLFTSTTLLEVGGLGMTSLFAHQFARRTSELGTIFRQAIVGRGDTLVSLDDAQGELYRELRRARRHGRPLSVLAISVRDHRSDSFDRVLLELQRENLTRFATARVTELVEENVKDFDLLLRQNDHLIALLPETPGDEAVHVADRLRALSENELGLELGVGIASFPDEEVTLGALLARAEANMYSRPDRAEVGDEAHARVTRIDRAAGESETAHAS
jgi:GGDEF domain-containing protein